MTTTTTLKVEAMRSSETLVTTYKTNMASQTIGPEHIFTSARTSKSQRIYIKFQGVDLIKLIIHMWPKSKFISKICSLHNKSVDNINLSVCLVRF
jgi:hypothetical protein